MVGNDHQFSVGFDDFLRIVQKGLKHFHFFVHCDAQGLEYLAEVFGGCFARCAGSDGIFKAFDGAEVFGASAADDDFGESSGVGDFAVLFEDVIEFFFVGFLYDVCCGVGG